MAYPNNQLASGLASQLGVAQEATWAGRTAPTRYLEFLSESLSLNQDYIESAGIRASQLVLRTDRRILNKKGVSGDVTLEVASSGFGLIFRNMLGVIDAGTNLGTFGKTYAATVGDTIGLGMTMQIGRPDNAGTVQAFDYTGLKVMSWDLSNAVDGILTLRMTLDGFDEIVGNTIAAATYASTGTNELFQYGEGVVSLNSVTQGFVTSLSLAGTNPSRNDRRFIRGDTRQKEQLRNAMVDITGSMTVEFSGLTNYNLFTAGTIVPLSFTWTGSNFLFDATHQVGLTATMPAVQITGATPNISGVDVTSHTLSFKVLANTAGTAPLTLSYTTQDLSA